MSIGRCGSGAVLAFVSILAAACGSRDDARESDPAPGAPAVRGAYGVYVTNEVSGDLTVIDPATHEAVATIALGKRPRGIRSAPDGRHLFIALSGTPISPPWVDRSTLPPADPSADGIGRFDTHTMELIEILRGPSDPEQTSISADGTRLYIANEDRGTATVMVIDTGETEAEFEVGGEPEGVTTSPDGRFVYVTSEEDNLVAVIDTARNALVAKVEVGARPRDTAFTPDGRRAYVTAENGGSVTIVDATRHEVLGTIQLDGENVRPMGIVSSPDGARMYVTTGRGGTVVVLDTASNSPVARVAVGARPWGVALSPDGALLYTANGPSNDVTVVDTATLQVVATVPAGTSPWGVVVVPRGETGAFADETS